MPLLYTANVDCQPCRPIDRTATGSMYIAAAMQNDIEPTGTLDVAERLRATRLALKLTQARLCRLTGISTASWNNAETGDARIGVDNAILLCQATGITLDWVFRGIRKDLPMEI